jgi:hypothetical protein
MNPVLGRDLHEIDFAFGQTLELVCNWPAQTETCA